MAIALGDNLGVTGPLPTDNRYYNTSNNSPWASVAEVNAALSGERYTGLTVNILGVEYWYKDGVTDPDLILKTTGGGSATSGENVTKEVTQASHGFAVKDFIGWSGGTYNKAIANGLYDGEFVGLVTASADTNTFSVTQSGYITGLTGLVTDTTYFLSEATAGLITSTAPTGDTLISKAVLVANSTTSGWVLPYAGYVITSGSSGGLNMEGDTVGGLTTYVDAITICSQPNLTFDGTNLNVTGCTCVSLGVETNKIISNSNLNICSPSTGNVNIFANSKYVLSGLYDCCVSLYYNNLEKFNTTNTGATVTGTMESEAVKITTGAASGCVLTSDATGIASWTTPAAGGIAMSGSTVNGLTTYVDATTICAQPTLTFTGDTTLGISGSTVKAALMTEVNGQIIDFGVNYHQAAIRDENYDAGMFRIDTRPTYPLFNVLYRASGATSEQVLFSVDKSGNTTITGTTNTGNANIESTGAIYSGVPSLCISDTTTRGTILLESQADQPTDFFMKSNGKLTFDWSVRNSASNHAMNLYTSSGGSSWDGQPVMTISTGGTFLFQSSTGENSIYALEKDCVALYYNGSEKFKTVTGGACTVGIHCATTCFKAPAITLTTGAGAGCVLQSDASGNATWVTPAAGATNLSIGSSTGTVVRIDSSTGTNATLPLATASLAGVVSNAAQTFAGTKTTPIWCGSTCVSSPIVIGTTCLRSTTWVGIEAAGADVYGIMSDANPTVAGQAFGGDLLFYGDKLMSAGMLVCSAGFAAANVICAPNLCGSCIRVSEGGTQLYPANTDVVKLETHSEKRALLIYGHTGSTTTNIAAYIINKGCTTTGGNYGLVVDASYAGTSVSGRSHGIWGQAGGKTSKNNHGVIGQLNGSNYGAAIHGSVGAFLCSVCNCQWAGYFAGPVCTVGTTWATTTCSTTICGISCVSTPLVRTNTVCLNGNILICEGASRTICVAQAIDGAAGDHLYICAGTADDFGTATGYVGGNAYLFGGRGSSETCVTASSHKGGSSMICGGAGGGTQSCFYGGYGGDAYVCGGAGGAGCGSTNTRGCVRLDGSILYMYVNGISEGYINSIAWCATSCMRAPVHCATTAFRTTGTGLRYCGATGCGSAVDWIATSDCRIKKCIEPITNALSTVDCLCGRCYELCEDGTLDMGLIAQEVLCVEPRLVSHGEAIEEYKKYGIEDEVLSLKYDKMAGLFVEAIKELKGQNECLQNQINELRKK